MRKTEKKKKKKKHRIPQNCQGFEETGISGGEKKNDPRRQESRQVMRRCEQNKMLGKTSETQINMEFS